VKIQILLPGEHPRGKVYSTIQFYQNMSYCFKTLDNWSEYKKTVTRVDLAKKFFDRLSISPICLRLLVKGQEIENGSGEERAKEKTMKIEPYLFGNRRCEVAVEFYNSHQG